MSTIIIKHRFAVWLEDAIEVEVPEGVTDVDEWARASYDLLYQEASENLGRRERGLEVEAGAPRLLWEDEHQADLDFPEAEVFVDREEDE